MIDGGFAANGSLAHRPDEDYGRFCPHCGTFTGATLVICPSCDGTLPFIIPSEQFTSGRPKRGLRRWTRSVSR